MQQAFPMRRSLALGAPPTEGVKYIGSKLRLIPYILALASRVSARTVLDGFSGTTRVSQAFAKSGYAVRCNDIAAWSEVFGTCYLLNAKNRWEFLPLIDHLNAVAPVDGWFTEHYGGETNGGCAVRKDGKKAVWQLHNSRKLDGVRNEIDALNLDGVEKSVALTSLILALDKVDSTLGHFSSYLHNWAPRSYGPLTLEIPDVLSSETEHQVFRSDIFDLIPNIAVDLAYFDPPYGSNNEKMPPSRVRYAAYYHLWSSVCMADEPSLFGRANRREDSSDKFASSVFEDYKRGESGRFAAVEAIDNLIQSANAQWIILSYSSGGRATAEELCDIISSNGKLLETLVVNYRKNVMSRMTWTNEWAREYDQPHNEYLFLMER